MKKVITSHKDGVSGACKALTMPYALISIQDPGDTKPRLPLQPHRLGCLFLEFDDINQEDYERLRMEQPSEPPDRVLMNETHAQGIADFVVDIAPRIETMVVQCLGGVCRSVGVAAAIEHVFFGSCKKYFHSSTVRIPNRHVYLLTLKALIRATGRVVDETVPGPRTV